VVLPGGTGTLLELAMVWELKNKGFLSGDKPIILLGKYWGRLAELVAGDDPDSQRHLLFADEPKDVVELLKGQSQQRV
jgi:predicted Rossmann-fold nucleotide-binding protein